MRMLSKASTVAAVAWLVMPAMARAEDGLGVGSNAPALKGLNWIAGKPFQIGDEPGQITVVEFWATWCQPCVQAVPHLTELQHQFSNKGVRIVGVTRQDPGNTLDLVKKFVKRQKDKLGYAVAFDANSSVYGAFMDAADQSGIPTAFVIEPAGRIAWIGHPEGGLDDVLAEIVGGKYDLEIGKKLYQIDQRIDHSYMFGEWDEVLKATDEAIELQPDSIARWLMKFTVQAHHLNKPAEAQLCAEKAFKLAEHKPDKIAAVAEAVVADDDAFKCNQLAGAALRSALKSWPGDADVRMAYFNWMSAAGKEKEALSFAAETIDVIGSEPERLSAFAKVLSSPSRKAMCGDMALRAVEMAIKVDPEEPEHHLTLFRILHGCKNDKNRANEVGQYFVQLASDDATLLNNFAWGLLTDDETKGQFNELALAAAEKLAKAPGGDGWAQLDTIALAKFENELIDDAVRIEAEALAKCPEGPAKAALQEALERFKKSKK